MPQNIENDNFWMNFAEEVYEKFGYIADRFPKPYDKIINIGNNIN